MTADGILAYEPDCGQLTLFGGSSKLSAELIGVNNLASSGDFFTAIRNRTSISLYDVERFPKPLAIMNFVEDVPQCVALSVAFGIVAVVTRDDRLHYFTLSKMRKLQVVTLPRTGSRRVIITEAWGLVVVDFGQEIGVYSANGEPVARYEVECPIAYLNVARSRSDFDFLVHSDLKGTLEVVEAARPEKRARIAQLVWPVCLAEYERESDCLIVISRTGKMLLFVEPFAALED
jgi:hypothetical protein